MQDRKIVDYMTIIESTSNELDKSVRYALEKGWELFGYPAFKEKLMFQTMIKYETEGERKWE